MRVRACPVPDGALLTRYRDRQGCYTDCFEVAFTRQVSLPEFIEAFYCTWLFRLERVVLTITSGRRIRDLDVKQLASGDSETFAVWTVEDREDHQILLCDKGGYTRSWLAAERTDKGSLLRFGSAVVPPKGQEMPILIKAATPLHRFYSRSLLRAALGKLGAG